MRKTAPLTPELLLNAYATGIFPMSEARQSQDVFWIEPRFRGILPVNGFHISRSLARAIKNTSYDIRVDTAFNQVVMGCANRPETWINTTIFDLYCELFHMGYAHSVEVWEHNLLVGGAYGVALGGAFFAESMFSLRPNTSKMSLAWLVDRLRIGGFTLIDTQFLTPHLRTLGGVEISRQEYRSCLKQALVLDADFNRQGTIPSGYSVIHRNGQTS